MTSREKDRLKDRVAKSAYALFLLLFIFLVGSGIVSCAEQLAHTLS